MDAQISQQKVQVKEKLYKKEKTQPKRNMKSLFIHLLQVVGINATALMITYSDVENWLKIISLILAIFYSVVKIKKEFSKD